MRSHDPDKMTTTPLESFPPEDQWDDWSEYDPSAWPRKVEKRYSLVPTICFNCEAACGLMAFVDKDTGLIRKLEGNPYHPGSRGKNCAKGPATINQVNDPNRILYPLKRVGPRGGGNWERTNWDEVLDTFAAKIRKAIVEDRRTEVMYHVGRPGEDGYVNRVLQSWGVDAHNSHTNVCSSGARVGYALWCGADRPSPDHANAKFILLLSSHLETGHYFNPHAQRIIEGKTSGAKMCVIDVRHSNTASKADWWLAPWPGTEAMLLLAIAKILLDEGLYNREFVETWVNWEETLAFLKAHRHASAPLDVASADTPPNQGFEATTTGHASAPLDTANAVTTPNQGVEATHASTPWSATDESLRHPTGRRHAPSSFDEFITLLREHYAFATPEAAAEECGVDAEAIREIAREIGKAGSALATHVWRNAAAGNLGGWQVSRCLEFLVVLMGAVGAVGGTNLNTDNKFVPPTFLKPPPQNVWNELLYPREYPLAFHEMSILLPHFLTDGRGKVAAYFTRVYNPVWTNPDGIMWERVLKDEAKIELHAALTPVWSETAQYADYVLPMGNGAERYDLMSQETHAATWIGFRQPVQRVARERKGESFEFTYEANPGEVWEETEFWIELSWRIDPDGSLGIRKYYESPYRPGEKIKIQEYYRWIFENSVPGLPEAAAAKGLAPLEYMSCYGAFLVKDDAYGVFAEQKSPTPNPLPQRQATLRDGASGFKTPSKKLELHSPTMEDWGWGEQTMPAYIPSHIHRAEMKPGEFEFVLVPTFRLPTLIHTRSANAKWLYELSNSNPVWIHPTDAAKLDIETGDLVRVATRIGHYVNKAWVTEGMRPGIVACSHHLGRWRLNDEGTDRMAGVKVAREELSPGVVRFRRLEDIAPYKSKDADTKRIWWTDGGVHQNLTFPVQPDPVSGQHCWHQRVIVAKAGPDDRYGDIFVDTNKSMEVYREWMAKTKPAPGPGGLRRPLWLDRAVRPTEEAYVIED